MNLSTYLSEFVLQEEDRLKFELGPGSLNPDYLRVLVFTCKDDQITFHSEGTEVMIDNLKGLIEDGHTSLLAVVVNSASESPYLLDMEIDLKISILKRKSWPYTYLSVKTVVTEALFKDGSGSETSWEKLDVSFPEQQVEVLEEGTYYKASWLDTYTDYTYEGGMEVAIDPETQVITYFYLWSNSESTSEGKVTNSTRIAITGNEGLSIPMVYSDQESSSHKVSGAEVCTVIKDYNWVHSQYPGESYELTPIVF